MPQPRAVQLRLVSGRAQFGRLEVFASKQWGSVSGRAAMRCAGVVWPALQLPLACTSLAASLPWPGATSPGLLVLAPLICYLPCLPAVAAGLRPELQLACSRGGMQKLEYGPAGNFSQRRILRAELWPGAL